MVSAAPLALRYAKQYPRHYHINIPTDEVVNGRINKKLLQNWAVYAAPRKYSNVAKVIFHASVKNVDAVNKLMARLRIWTATASGDPSNPDVANVPLGSRLNAGSEFTPSSIINRQFAKAHSFVEIPAAMTSGSSCIISQEFDVFDINSQDFFQAWNSAEKEDDYLQFNLAIELDSGSSTSIEINGFSYTVIQAPGPQNNTVSYVQVWPPQQDNASGPLVFDRQKSPTHDQIRGAWSWIYNADEWDGAVEVNLLLIYSSGNNNVSISVEVQKVNSTAQASGSTSLVHAEGHVVSQQEHGIIRTNGFFAKLTNGQRICADWRHLSGGSPVGSTAQCTVLFEIVQKGCNKTTSYFSPAPFFTRANTGIAAGDPIPWIFPQAQLIDPQWFANYPDALFLKNRSIGQIVQDINVDPGYQIQMNADLLEDQNGPVGLTPTTVKVSEHRSPVLAMLPGIWSYEEFDLSVNPLAFAGQRKLFARIIDTWRGVNNAHPAQLALKYTYTVPNTEILELGPLFPVGEFAPEGCASTSAGLGDPGVLVITNGSTIPKKFDPVSGKVEDNGVPVPFEGEFPTSTTVENAAASPNGGIVPGRYEYRYTFRNCCTGKESDPNPDTFVIDSAAQGASPAARHNISFVGVRIPSDDQICEICIYRTVKDGSFPIMAKVGCFDPDVTTVFVDDVPDSLLDFTSEGLALLNAPMPCVPIVVDYRNRLFGFGDIPQLAPAGTVSVVQGSKTVTGDENVDWDRCLEGKFIQVQGDCRVYEIERILPPAAGTSPPIGRLKLVDEYEGETDSGLTYTICGHMNRVFFSEPLEPECWPNINFLDVEPGDGDKLMGGASNFDSLVICKRRKTYLLRFRENPLTEIVVPSRISTDIGCIAPRSFAQVENGTVWLSDRGIAMFDGRGVAHIPASDRFNQILIDPDNPRYIRRDGQGRVIDAVGAFYPKREQYLLLLPTVQTARGSNIMLVWDTSLDNITLYEFCQEFQSMVVAKDADGNERVYLGDTNGFVWMFDVGSNDGAGFPNATGTVRGTATGAGFEQGAAFLDDAAASFITGGLPQLAALSGVEGLTPSFGVSPNESGDLGLAGVCMFTRPAGAALDDPWIQRTVYAATDTRLYVTPGWGTETPSVGDEYMIGAIQFVAAFKPKSMGTDDALKRDWKQVLTFAPQDVSSQLRVELLPDFANIDPDELTVLNSEGESGEGRTFDLGFQRGRIKRPVGRRIYNYMQVRMKNFAPDEPVEILNHALLSNPRPQ